MRIITAIVAFCLSWVPMGCTRGPELALHSFAGATMGTTYSVKIVVGPGVDLDRNGLAQSIEKELRRVNAKMSSWDQASDVCRFNRHRSTTVPLEISPDTAFVIKKALHVAALTHGAFDPTIDPLIQRWGFGTRERKAIPSPEELSDLLAKTGYQKLDLDQNQLESGIPNSASIFPPLQRDTA